MTRKAALGAGAVAAGALRAMLKRLARRAALPSRCLSAWMAPSKSSADVAREYLDEVLGERHAGGGSGTAEAATGDHAARRFPGA